MFLARSNVKFHNSEFLYIDVEKIEKCVGCSYERRDADQPMN